MAEKGKKDLGKLPPTALFLLFALGITWFGIISYVAYDTLKKKKKS